MDRIRIDRALFTGSVDPVNPLDIIETGQYHRIGPNPLRLV